MISIQFTLFPELATCLQLTQFSKLMHRKQKLPTLQPHNIKKKVPQDLLVFLFGGFLYISFPSIIILNHLFILVNSFYTLLLGPYRAETEASLSSLQKLTFLISYFIFFPCLIFSHTEECLEGFTRFVISGLETKMYYWSKSSLLHGKQAVY